MSQLPFDFEKAAEVFVTTSILRPAARDEIARHHLRLTLIVGVPMWIRRVRAWSVEQRHRRAQELGKRIAYGGDRLQWPAKGQAARDLGKDEEGKPLEGGEAIESSGEMLNLFVEALACLAFEPGGARFRDMHWEVK